MSYSITIDGISLPILVRKRRGVRNMVIRYQPKRHALSLTLPRYASLKQGLHFVEQKRGWIAQQLAEMPQPVPLADGRIIPLLGREYTLRHVGGRGVVRVENDEILVPGDLSFMERRVREWLKAQARDHIGALTKIKADAIDVRCKKITLRDTSSHWGSCSHSGTLSFSWRLVLAPLEILDYVVCHEVAHLAQHNHSPAFWRIVAELCPAHLHARSWLKKHGPELYRYG